ncbi:MAG: ABC transporter permease [Ostreibacterium sp.]
MQWFFEIIKQAILQIFSFDANLYEIIALTLVVSLSALFIATLLALPFAAWLSLSNSKLKRFCIMTLHALMGFPPVVAGLLVYMLLSHRGPFGQLNLLFSPTAMIIAQILLIFPIVCGLSQQIFRQQRYYLSDLFFSLQLSRFKQLRTIIYESRFQILGALVTGFGRGLAEVGAVMIVGGNIANYTRTITTTIALETSKGELIVAVSLGIILLVISLLLNSFLLLFNQHLADQQQILS